MTQREHMGAEVQNWREIWQTKKQFCQQRRIEESTYGYRITRSTEKRKKGFVPLNELPPGHTAPIEIIYLNGIKLLHWEHGGFVIYYKRLEH